jgi:hypothetical protein
MNLAIARNYLLTPTLGAAELRVLNLRDQQPVQRPLEEQHPLA